MGSTLNRTPKAPFPKSAHLLKHADFQQVYEKGRRHFSANVTVFFMLRPKSEEPLDAKDSVNLPGPRVGFTVGKVLGGSVVRNRIRRRTREAVRLHYSRFVALPVDIILHPKKSVLTVEFEELSREIERSLEIVQQRAALPSTVETNRRRSRAQASSRAK
jgi:ribonuclease P protein component